MEQSQKLRALRWLGGLAAALALAGVATAQTAPRLPASRYAIDLDSRMKQLYGQVEVVLKLEDPSLAAAQGDGAKLRTDKVSREASRAYLKTLSDKQDAVAGAARALGARELARLSKSHNAIVVSVNALQIGALAQIPGVVSVRPVPIYTRDLATTVPYVGGTAAHAVGRDGTGVRVAVLDSGIDYTHRNLGGSGNLADYNNAFAARETAFAGFPTAKVIGGYDFVGELWPNGARSEDPNPLDQQGHGTHVADIVAGRSLDGSHKGMAPGASLYAVKVCSAVATSCNGVALLKGVEFALDPDGDGDLSDAVDVINMSLGSAYGQKEDDLSEASANAARFGVIVVASAGNNADRPYIVGSPSSAPEVISVAQTAMPNDKAYPLTLSAPAAIAGTYPNTATLDWAPLGAGFSGNVVFVGRACTGEPLLASPSGKIALVDRGVCSIADKVRNASDAGAIGVLVGLVAPGDAVTFANDPARCPNPTVCKPGLVITQATANLIKANIAAPVVAAASSSNSISLAGSMAGTSSRGPSVSYHAIKPDLGAPGASISAIVGTGTGAEAFGGTSGAAPVVSGAAAILRQAYPGHSVTEIKALLTSTANLSVYTNPATQPGVLAPITRIGGGELRVKRALDSRLAAWNPDDAGGNLSFGYRAVTEDQSIKRTVRVRNYSGNARSLAISTNFRYPNDAASGAVSFKAPATVWVPANGSAEFDIQMRIKAAALPNWNLNGGSNGGVGILLNDHEFDGYVKISDGAETINLPWQVLPHKAAEVEANSDNVRVGSTVKLRNSGVQNGRVEVFALTGTGKKFKKSQLPQPGDNFALVDLRHVGVRLVGTTLQFAVNTIGERAHPNYPAEFDVYIDTNGDKVADYVVFNAEQTGFGQTGTNLTFVQKLDASGAPVGGAAAYFYTDADLNSANATLSVPLAALGLTPASPIGFDVYAFDNYFTGNLTDAITGMNFTPGTPRYTASVVQPLVPAGGSTSFTVAAVAGGELASPSQTGLLLFYRDAKAKKEAQTISVTP